MSLTHTEKLVKQREYYRENRERILASNRRSSAKYREKRKIARWNKHPPITHTIRCVDCWCTFSLADIDKMAPRRKEWKESERINANCNTPFKVNYVCPDCVAENEFIESRQPNENDLLLIEEEGEDAAMLRVIIEQGRHLAYHHLPLTKVKQPVSDAATAWALTERNNTAHEVVEAPISIAKLVSNYRVGDNLILPQEVIDGFITQEQAEAIKAAERLKEAVLEKQRSPKKAMEEILAKADAEINKLYKEL